MSQSPDIVSHLRAKIQPEIERALSEILDPDGPTVVELELGDATLRLTDNGDDQRDRVILAPRSHLEILRDVYLEGARAALRIARDVMSISVVRLLADEDPSPAPADQCGGGDEAAPE